MQFHQLHVPGLADVNIKWNVVRAEIYLRSMHSTLSLLLRNVVFRLRTERWPLLMQSRFMLAAWLTAEGPLAAMMEEEPRLVAELLVEIRWTLAEAIEPPRLRQPWIPLSKADPAVLKCGNRGPLVNGVSVGRRPHKVSLKAFLKHQEGLM